MIEIIKGDLLKAKEKYIAHQCNAVSNQAGGLAYYLFKAFPYADIYSERPYPYQAIGRNFPGRVVIKGDGDKNRYVINMLAQYYPGSPSEQEGYKNLKDGAMARVGYFNRCLIEIGLIQNLESIAFPFNIGCGLAGGNWATYLRILEIFAAKVKERQNARVVLYDNQ